MGRLNVVLVSPEVVPFAKTGGLADVAGSLPRALAHEGCSVSVFTPFYHCTKKGNFSASLFKEGLWASVSEGVRFYFIDRDEYFDRGGLYGTPAGDYPDNAARFAFFASAVLHSMAMLKIKADILHCNDWQSALIPFYLKHHLKDAPLFKNTKILFTIHNLAYQGLFAKEVMPEIGIGEEFFTPEALEFYGKLNFMKAGILYSDAVSTVSRGYAREILTKEFGCGLDGLLYTRRNRLYGILNGVDYGKWSPENDAFIKARYNARSVAKKEECKKDLLEYVKLKSPLGSPVLGIISRLAAQKGIDIVIESIPDIISMGCRLVILGAGDEKHQTMLLEAAKKYPKHVAVNVTFDNALAHKIEAGADMFLMPSRYEPCGLNQMYSLRYGTIPVVRATGGLDDTIIDYTADPGNGNGFKFKNAAKADFLDALTRALSIYRSARDWKTLMLRGMGLDFSWEHSADEYIKLYKEMGKKK